LTSENGRTDDPSVWLRERKPVKKRKKDRRGKALEG